MNKILTMLSAKPFQETLHGSFCGPASLKMVLDYYGVEKSEEELAKLTNKDDDLGISSQDIKKAAESFGFKVKIKDFATYEDIQEWLDKGVPVIVDWFFRGRYDYDEDAVADGHNSVVVGLDKEYIYLQDPEVGRIRKINREDFYRVWFDFSSDHIEKWKDMVIRQMVVIYK